jgi:ABC-2 type transport system permease protein
MPTAGAQFNQLRTLLGAELNLVDEDLSDGSVSGNADLLLLLAPENLDEKSVFAVDQFLMQGGTVIAATAPFAADLTGNSLSLRKVTTGLEDWLAHHGVSIDEKLVMDSRNAAFPIPVTRNVGGFALREWRMLDYPWFLDIRDAGLASEHPVTADLPQLTMAWASPVTVDGEKNGARTVTPLLKSSPQAWLSDSTNVMPSIDANGNSDYTPGDERGEQLVGVVTQGSFSSYFGERESPLLAAADAAESSRTDAAAITAAGEDQGAATEDNATADAATDPVISSVITRSPDSARLIVLASNDFLQDQVLQLLGTASDTEYLNSLQLVANNIDWSLEDAGLLSIRSRGHFNRTLPPLEREQQVLWETLNYVLAALAIGLIAFTQRSIQRRREARWQQLLAQ